MNPGLWERLKYKNETRNSLRVVNGDVCLLQTFMVSFVFEINKRNATAGIRTRWVGVNMSYIVRLLSRSANCATSQSLSFTKPPQYKLVEK